MRNRIKKELLSVFKTLFEAHETVKDHIGKNDSDTVVSLLGDCQNTAVQIGDIIESSEGEGFCTIHMLEEYCEAAYEVSVGINDGMDGAKAKKILDKALVKAEQSVRADIGSRFEIVFMPYKAAMWDSLESVWIAANDDPDCDAYVVPIPYYDKNSDDSFGAFHYEGDQFPEYVPITHYDAYNVGKRQPDIIYIHNPYDYANNVTSVDPRFYSDKLKKYTDTLVYIPYYSTTGGMSPDQIHLPAYYNADYIVVQAPYFSELFDTKLPKSRFIATGSPKFDRTVRMCREGVELPEEWREKISGKKVYFFNTSIGGMLDDTARFIKKLRYVFDCFAGRDDACLLWRPHPLLRQTMESMRKEYIGEFDKLKQYFHDSNIGILDETSDITRSIAASNAYIGDAGTSVTSLFGVAGKPIFVLNNSIASLPQEGDKVAYQLVPRERPSAGNWFISWGDDLYYSESDDCDYRFICKLSPLACGIEYQKVLSVGEKFFVCPSGAFDILLVDKTGVQKKYKLKELSERTPFIDAISYGKYIFLIPYYYPAVVRFDTETEEISYITEDLEYISGYARGIYRTGGACVHKGKLYIGSPISNAITAIDVETCETKKVIMNHAHDGGSMTLNSDGELIWITPFLGSYIMSWDPDSGKMNFYKEMPGGFFCIDPKTGLGCFDYPFSSMIYDDEYVYFAAYWACMCVKVNRKTGVVEKYDVPVNVVEVYEDGYHYSEYSSFFLSIDDKKYFFSYYKRKLFKFENNAWEEVKISFDREDILESEQGFGKIQKGLIYACLENAYNTLDDFLDNNVTGKQFDRDEQLKAYGEIAVNIDGTCGQKTHEIIKSKVMA